MQYFKDEVCGIDNCREKRYYIDNGFTVCKNGHQKEGQVQTQVDEDDFGTQGRTTRQKKEIKGKASRIYRGHKALELYLQSYQLILWNQCYGLIHSKKLPPELENVVKDLWALRLQLLRKKAEKASESEAGFKTYSSQSEADLPSENEHDRTCRKWKDRGEEIPSLIESLGLCYLGAILLRLPLSLGEMHRWAVREEIPFIRAVRLVPRVMKEKLPSHYLGALDTLSPLEPDHLCRTVHQLVFLYNYHFDMVFPALNHPLLLFKHVKNLALPLEIYTAVRQLSSLFACDFAFPTPQLRKTFSSLPEIQLISLLVIATKLYHPFDSLDRYTATPTEPGTLSIDWDTWCQAQQDYDSRLTSDGKLERGKALTLSEEDVFTMTGNQLDHYLDWYQQTWLDSDSQSHHPKRLPPQLLDMFPTGTLPPPQQTSTQESQADQAALAQKLQIVQASLKQRGMISEASAAKATTEPVRRIGSAYKRYRGVGELEGRARTFYEAVAGAVGVSLGVLVRAVGAWERRMVDLGEEGRRRRGGGEMSGRLSGGEDGGLGKEEGVDVEMVGGDVDVEMDTAGLGSGGESS